ncbi:MAG: hypothetical protein K2M20_14845 [Lachnospiraceae bacterium]|nr:hypothetical protein [Lachnospiraceae bacterium]
MEYNVHEIDSRYDFAVQGVSYIGSPKPYTAMYVTKKVAHLLENIRGLGCCLVFAETGMEADAALQEENCLVFSDNPQLAYVRFVNGLADRREEREKNRKYTCTEDGYYLGENVQIGENARIEPTALIGHDVVIGKNAFIGAGAVIKNAVIGDDFVCNAHAVIGSPGFTMCEDEKGNKLRIPSMGRVVIGNFVEVGVGDNISVGSSGDTIIEDYVKLDVLIHIGHDVHIQKNAELTAGAIVGGFDQIGERAYCGLNAAIRNRVTVGADGFIGMGAVVTKSVEPGVTVVGNPARKFERAK